MVEINQWMRRTQIMKKTLETMVVAMLSFFIVSFAFADNAATREIGRDGRFIAYDDGTVLDTSTNLMWAAKDNGSNINWQGAKSYCESYRGGGYTDWRMPTQHELLGLFNASKSQKVECGLSAYIATDLIYLTCCWVWGSETRGSDAYGFDFGKGPRSLMPQSKDYINRALPVRSGK